MPAKRKPEAELQRPRERRGGDSVAPAVKGQRRGATAVPRAHADWHADAKRWFTSLKTSGQADRYEDSDWAFAVLIAGLLSDYLEQTRKSPEMFKALLSAMEKMLGTEADRLKARLELTEPAPKTKSASVTAIDKYKKDLAG